MDEMTLTCEANTALIRYPRFNELHQKIQACQRRTLRTGEPKCMSLEGLSGAGKTTLVLTYANSFPVIETEEGRIVPVLYLSLQSPIGIRDVAAEALQRVGDPGYDKGTRAAMTLRLIGLIKACCVRLIILDEFHHLYGSRTNYVLREVSEWLKCLIKKTGVPFLVVGIEGHVRPILQANPQLSRLFAFRETLEPFAWNASEQETIQQFSLFVEFAEKAFGRPLSDEIERVDLLYRLHYATGGIVGNIMSLMDAAVDILETRKRKDKSGAIDLATLSKAYREQLQEHMNGRMDPFSKAALGQPTLPAPPAPQPEETPPSSRGRKPKAQEPSIKETLKAK